MPLVEPVSEVVKPFTHLGVDQGLRGVVLDQLDQGLEGPGAQGHLGLHDLDLAQFRPQVVTELGDGVELRRLGGPGVGRLRQDFPLDLLDQDPERGGLPRCRRDRGGRR